MIRTDVDAFSLSDLHGPTDDGRRPGAACLLADRLLQLGRTVILVGHRLASGLLMSRPRRIAPAHIGASLVELPAHIGASMFGMPAHVGAQAVGSQPGLQTLAPLRSRPSDPPVGKSSAVPAQSEAGDNFDWGMLRRDGMVLMLNTAHERKNRPDSPDRLRMAGHDDTALFFHCPDPDAAYAYLCGRGLEAEAPVTTRYGMKQVYVSDPDGYSLCFQSRAA